MGFRKDAYATVWDTKPISDTMTQVRLSISRKNKNTNEYETDFSGFCSFIGTATARKALNLCTRDRIKLGDVDVTNKYDKEKKVTYTNYKVFSFLTSAEYGGGGSQPTPTSVAYEGVGTEGDEFLDGDESLLPF